MSGTREATHAGSWYTSNGARLRQELDQYLSDVHPLPDLNYRPPISNAKAIIAPHAGYSYSGPAAAWAYASIPTDRIKRVFLLGPSHHVYLNGMALTGFERYETPVGGIPICRKTTDELKATGLFSIMQPSTDEDEHSLEMHLPYIRHIFSSRDDLRLVPILVGHPSSKNLSQVCSTLQKYWEDPETFFVISSDFCHWGKRFSCTPYYPEAPDPPNPVPPVPKSSSSVTSTPLTLVRQLKESGSVPIWKSIQYMDHEGMDILREPARKGAKEEWEAYLERTKNTICGRNPISVLVSLVQHIYGGKTDNAKPQFTFVRYEQSSQCKHGGDSSVSYVSGVLRIPEQ